ncbi:MAG: TonB-dependent receptor plug domain-containing protein [Cyclobacteriaceae bacterium]
MHSYFIELHFGLSRELLGVFIMLLGGSSFTSTAQTQPAEIAKRFEIYHEQIPTEKVYIHTSREVLTLGDTLYLSTYVLNGMDHKPTALSGMLHVDLISPEDKIIHSLRLKIDSLGRSHGAFTLSDSLNAGNYTLRGYTNYQLNYDEDYLFSKDIKLLPRLESQKVTEENTDRIPQVNLKFFPEGGELIAGNTNFIAFKAVDQHGQPIEISGNILDEKGNKITQIATEHDGMGRFMLVAEEGARYSCFFQYAGKEFSQPLPNMLSSGYLLHVHPTKSRVSIEVKPHNASIDQTFLIIQSRGKLLYVMEPKPDASNIQLWLRHTDLPTGIIQLTFFDPQHRAVAERLIFNENPVTRTRLKVSPDKETYRKRSGIDLDLSLSKQNGELPVLASLSTTVIPRNLYLAPEHTIASFLHLNSDLKGYIKNPSYYLNPENPDRVKHMDLLMMTHGWRRFEWEKVINTEGPEIVYPYEKGVRVDGKVTGYINKKKEVTTDLYLSFLENPLIQLQATSQENGMFWFDGLNFTDTVTAYVKTIADKEKRRIEGKVNSNTLIHIDDPYVPPVASGMFKKYTTTETDQWVINRGEKLFDISAAFDEKTIILEEISIEEKIHPENDPFNRPGMMHSMPDNRVVLDSMPFLYPTIFHYLSMIPGVQAIMNQSVTIRGGTPMFLLDGIAINFDQLMNINVRDILFIDVLKGPRAFAYGPRAIGGAIVLFTRRGDEYRNLPDADPEGLAVFPLVGYTAPREFYMPDYSNPTESEKIRPDFRSTLYWNPLLLMNEGLATDHFYTSDETGTFIIYCEGIGMDGEIFSGEAVFEVR